MLRGARARRSNETKLLVEYWIATNYVTTRCASGFNARFSSYATKVIIFSKGTLPPRSRWRRTNFTSSGEEEADRQNRRLIFVSGAWNEGSISAGYNFPFRGNVPNFAQHFWLRQAGKREAAEKNAATTQRATNDERARGTARINLHAHVACEGERGAGETTCIVLV